MGISERPWGYFVDGPAPSDTVSRVGGPSEAIEVVNDVEYGLSAGIVSSVHSEVNRYIKEANFGVIKANEKTMGFELHVSSGGTSIFKRNLPRTDSEGLDFFIIIKILYVYIIY